MALRRLTWALTASGTVVPGPVSLMPSADATWSQTNSGPDSGERSTNQSPSGKFASRSLASCRARRVLPAPPGPVRVKSRLAPSKAAASASSASRPTKRVSGMGRVMGLVTPRRGPSVSHENQPATSPEDQPPGGRTAPPRAGFSSHAQSNADNDRNPSLGGDLGRLNSVQPRSAVAAAGRAGADPALHPAFSDRLDRRHHLDPGADLRRGFPGRVPRSVDDRPRRFDGRGDQHGPVG